MSFIKKENGCVLIAGIEIKPEVFNNEMVNYRLINRECMIDDLYSMIGECGFGRQNDKELMIEDQQYLISLEDEFVYSSILTNEIVVLSENKEQFLQISHSVLKANGLSGDEADTIIRNFDFIKPVSEEEDSKLETVYEIKQFDIWASNELCSFGVFTDKEIAIQEMLKGLNELYPEIGQELQRNGDTWISDGEHEFIIKIQEIELNKFGEL